MSIIARRGVMRRKPASGSLTYIDVSFQMSWANPQSDTDEVAINLLDLNNDSSLTDMDDIDGNATSFDIELTSDISLGFDDLGDSSLTGLPFTGNTIYSHSEVYKGETLTITISGFAANQSGRSLEFMCNCKTSSGASHNRLGTFTIQGVLQTEINSYEKDDTVIYTDIQANSSGEIVIVVEATGTALSNNNFHVNALRIGK